MDLLLLACGAGSAAAGSFITGYTLKLIEHRREIRSAGAREVEQKRAVLRFDALRHIRGQARQLYHYLSHVVHDPLLAENYSSAARDTTALMRSTARAEVEVLGEEYVRTVHKATDVAMKLVEARERSPKEPLALNVRYDLGFPGDMHNSWFDILAEAAIPEARWPSRDH